MTDAPRPISTAELAAMKAEVAELAAMKPAIEETNILVKDMVTDLYGKKQPTPADPNHRVGGRLQRLETIGNGGMKIKLPAALWGFLATVTAALIAGTVTLVIAFSG